jgi:hypothetical protein
MISAFTFPSACGWADHCLCLEEGLVKEEDPNELKCKVGIETCYDVIHDDVQSTLFSVIKKIRWWGFNNIKKTKEEKPHGKKDPVKGDEEHGD